MWWRVPARPRFLFGLVKPACHRGFQPAPGKAECGRRRQTPAFSSERPPLSVACPSGRSVAGMIVWTDGRGFQHRTVFSLACSRRASCSRDGIACSGPRVSAIALVCRVALRVGRFLGRTQPAEHHRGEGVSHRPRRCNGVARGATLSDPFSRSNSCIVWARRTVDVAIASPSCCLRCNSELTSNTSAQQGTDSSDHRSDPPSQPDLLEVVAE